MSMHVSNRALLAGARRFERKDATGDNADLGALTKSFEAINKAFEEFKSKNDASITEVKKGFDDVVRRDEVKKISDAIEEAKKVYDAEILALKRAKTAAGGGEEKTPEQIEYGQKWRNWFRKGESRDFTENDLREMEKKALSVASDPDGGFTVLPEVDRMIDERLKLVSPMRQYATVRQIGTASYKRFVNLHGAASGWVGESDARTATATPTLKEIEIPVHEIYAMPVASQSLLDDSFVNIEQWLAAEVELEFSYQEGVAFISGTGLKKPTGILSQTIAADTAADLAWGTVGYYPSGASGAFDATVTFNGLIDMIYGLKPGYRANASFLANRRTWAAARKLKDTTGQYLWQPPVQAGAPAQLLGYAANDMEDMPDMAANSYSMAFGDWKRAYTIVDRIGTRVLRDPYTSKPNVLFYTTKRVGGQVTMHEAYKLLKFATS
jgi:HK97 family phage major capsid protein